ncbi:MAG: cobalamin-binding protein [Pirellulales bacterium]|nr:cobalamin-binding protein [Pirellulales bacterium]
MTLRPQRIASLLASSTEMLYALGLGDRLVAVSHECDFPAEAATKPRVTTTNVAASASSGEIDQQVQTMLQSGAALYEIDVERLAALQPDLIVTQAQCDVCAVRYEDVVRAVETHPALRQARIVAFNPMTLDDIFTDILRVGEAAGVAPVAAQYVAGLQARVENIRHRATSLGEEQRPRTACIEWIEPMMLAANWTPELVKIAGGKNLLTKAGVHSTWIEWPAVVALDPEVIVVGPCGFDLARTLEEATVLPALPGWSELTAVRAGRVYAVDGNAYFNRSGPRMVESLEILAHLLHPQLFGPPHLPDREPPYCRL